MTGVKDWSKKYDAFKTLFNAATPAALYEKVIPASARSKREDFSDNFRKWHRSEPKTPEARNFFDTVVEALNCTNFNGTRLIECSFGEFIEALPSDKQKLLGRHKRAKSRGNEHLVIRIPAPNLHDKEEDWLRVGRVDQRYMYLNIDAVQQWKHVIEDPEYRGFSYCHETLEQLLDSSEWLSMLDSEEHCDVVFLGAGTPKKEILVMAAIQKQQGKSGQRKPNIVLVDGSFYMLIESHDQIRNYLRSKKLTNSVEVHTIHADFKNLKSAKHWILSSEENSRRIFFVLGGTFGNNDEADLILAVLGVSKPGDLLVLNVELIDEENVEEFQRKLLASYSAAAVKDLVLGPVRSLLDSDDVSPDFEHRRDLLVPRITVGGQVPSVIPGTIAVELSLQVREQVLALSLSKRYKKTELYKFLKDREFEPVLEPVPHRNQSLHQQMVFKRV
ncbi:MAG: hypothetical protein CML99_07215 [Rhodobiaceae bacterium]|nr:hypothetical protein [Rhodobiaceae bacterium]|tara:strand:- start:343 stop:1677 length:1335 start_codon:yes stop_codon:yes gene_type:complete